MTIGYWKALVLKGNQIILAGIQQVTTATSELADARSSWETLSEGAAQTPAVKAVAANQRRALQLYKQASEFAAAAIQEAEAYIANK